MSVSSSFFFFIAFSLCIFCSLSKYLRCEIWFPKKRKKKEKKKAECPTHRSAKCFLDVNNIHIANVHKKYNVAKDGNITNLFIRYTINNEKVYLRTTWLDVITWLLSIGFRKNARRKLKNRETINEIFTELIALSPSILEIETFY
jgi:hypothetical protein